MRKNSHKEHNYVIKINFNLFLNYSIKWNQFRFTLQFDTLLKKKKAHTYFTDFFAMEQDVQSPWHT